MHQVAGHSLWLGHAGDGREVSRILDLGIRAVVQLAAEERPLALTRELVYCRFPLLDGDGNPAWLLRAAIRTVAELNDNHVPTLVVCGAGMSRSPAIAAAAIATATGETASAVMQRLSEDQATDVSPAFWGAAESAMGQR